MNRKETGSNREKRRKEVSSTNSSSYHKTTLACELKHKAVGINKYVD